MVGYAEHHRKIDATATGSVPGFVVDTAGYP
jgi:hypothetical protein